MFVRVAVEINVFDASERVLFLPYDLVMVVGLEKGVILVVVTG